MKTPLLLVLLSLGCIHNVFSQAEKYEELVAIGEMYLEKEQSDSARLYFQSAHQLDLQDVQSIYLIGVSYAFDCFDSEVPLTCLRAIQWLDKADSIESGFRYLYRIRGNCKKGMKNYYGALEDFEKAVGNSPDPELYSSMAFIHKELGEPELAIKWLSESIKTDPNEPIYYANRAIIYREMSEFDKALIDHEMTIQLAPELPDFVAEKGITLLAAERLGEASLVLDKAIALAPQSAYLYYFRGYAKEQLSEYQQALDDLNTAIKLDSTNSDSFLLRGEIKSALGKEGCEDIQTSALMGNFEAVLRSMTLCGN